MKRLGVFLLPPGWDASPLQGYPPALNSPVPICTPGWREALWEKSVLPKNTTQCPRPGLEPGPLAPESSALTMRPPRLPRVKSKILIIPNFLLPFSYRFSRPFYSLATLRISYSFRRKKLGVNYGQSLEIGAWINDRYQGMSLSYFTTNFCTKTDNLCVSFRYVRMPSLSKTDCCADRSILVLPSAYQECLMTFKMMTSQVV